MRHSNKGQGLEFKRQRDAEEAATRTFISKNFKLHFPVVIFVKQQWCSPVSGLPKLFTELKIHS
jgi:hypothetical protein